MLEPTEEFLSFIKQSPEAAANMFRAVQLFFEYKPVCSEPSRPERGPKPAVEGERYELQTDALSRDEMDRIIAGTADAVVIEKMHAYLKGFFNGATVLGGGL